jgi:hypothetical protein
MSTQKFIELEAWSKTRPIRIAFLVEKCQYDDLVLDGIFADCYSRWGGRFSPIIPCRNGEVVGSYWPWLEAFDADIIYSYVDLPVDAVLEISERLAPADYIVHQMGEQPRLDIFGFKPHYQFGPLSSLSTVFRLARHNPMANGNRKVRVINSWHTEQSTRFLTDNLGTYSRSAATGMFPNDAYPYADLLTIVSDEFFHDRKYGVPRDLDRVANEWMALREFGEKRATGVALLSSLFAPRLEVRDWRWSGAFNLVVGESFEDRLLFWNARLLIPTWLDQDLCCFRATLDQMQDDEFVGQLAQIINSRNHVNHGSGGQPELRVRSASHTSNELNGIVSTLQVARVWSAIGKAEIVPNGDVIPSDNSLQSARENALYADGLQNGVGWAGFRWVAPIARPPVIEPEHLVDAPPRQAFTRGLWAHDFAFEYDGSPARAAQRNKWILPKQWRMAGAFVGKFNKRGLVDLPPICRSDNQGNLTIFAGVDRAIESITIPTFEDAVRHALCRDAVIWRTAPSDPPRPAKRAQWLRPSSESAYLTGMLGMTGGLRNAKRFLLHPFLQEIFASMGGTPNLADADISFTADSLAKRSRGRPVFNLQDSGDRAALAGLIVKAAKSVKLPKTHVSLDELQSRWRLYREGYWSHQPDENKGAQEDRKLYENDEQHAIDACLVEMRKQRMMFQGYAWTCPACQHRNWVDFQELNSDLSCDVCRTTTDMPVGIPWQFRPNEFLLDCLRSHSVLSLIWVMAALQDRAKQSFIYAGPTCFGFTSDYDHPDAEADLLAVVDGKTILCEIKSAWRSLRAVHIKDFVSLAKRLKPDHAIMAVMENGSRFNNELQEAGVELIASGIQFELLTPSEYSIPDDPYL